MQVPIAIAANICGVAVNVLAEQIRDGDVDCETDAGSAAVVENDSGEPPHQRGLVNIALTDITVQVPVSVAANICEVAVNVLARNMHTRSLDCLALADADTTA